MSLILWNIINISGIGGFIACKALSKRNDEPHRASRPWDTGRDGFVMGEGGGEVRDGFAMGERGVEWGGVTYS